VCQGGGAGTMVEVGRDWIGRGKGVVRGVSRVADHRGCFCPGNYVYRIGYRGMERNVGRFVTGKESPQGLFRKGFEETGVRRLLQW